MFETLTSKLQSAFRHLRGMGKLTEANMADALREVRVALLDADVNYKVARDFIERVKAKALGQEVIQSIQPGQQVIKILYDELVALLGDTHAGLDLSGSPTSILLVGLHGSGKTTTAGKLARLLLKQGRQPLLVAADVYRPAAMDQLETLGRQLQVPTFTWRDQKDVLAIARAALDHARQHHCNVLLFDTAGRLQIDEPLVQELVRLRELVRPREILLVLDAATGQEAVHVATHFDQALQITGAILTKLDGDARGGAALSFRAVVGKPIKFVGVGEKLDDLEPFHPDRMASRILGMGDIISLVEKAAEAVTQDDARRLEEKMRRGQFTLEDFLEQLRQMRKLGPLESILKLLPGGPETLPQADLARQEKELRRMEAILCAMTPQERQQPQILNASRRYRIARGSGVPVSEVNELLKKFAQMQQMMKKMGKLQKLMGRMGGGLPGPWRR
jgi:signal recognition particle subunit SRP54